MSLFNEDQRDHMKYLASLPREVKCACGWARRGQCDLACYGCPEKGGVTDSLSRDASKEGGQDE